MCAGATLVNCRHPITGTYTNASGVLKLGDHSFTVDSCEIVSTFAMFEFLLVVFFLQLVFVCGTWICIQMWKVGCMRLRRFAVDRRVNDRHDPLADAQFEIGEFASRTYSEEDDGDEQSQEVTHEMDFECNHQSLQLQQHRETDSASTV